MNGGLISCWEACEVLFQQRCVCTQESANAR